MFRTPSSKKQYRIYYLKDRTNPHRANIESDYSRIQLMALSQKKEKVINEWVNLKMIGSYIRISEQYKNCEFTRKWIH